jgi:hypothetical protein
LLLLVFLFNIVGYNLIFWTMQNQARHNLLKRFDTHQYSENELVVLTIPLSLPYPVESQEFERNDIEFEYQNQTYRLVERKFENDTMFIVCIKDYESKLIAQKLMDYVNLSNDLPSGTKQALSFLGKIYKDYTTTGIFSAFTLSVTETPSFISMQESSVPQLDLAVESPPPDLLF